jgi:hypothetical protein
MVPDLIYISLQKFNVVDSISLLDEILKKVTIELLEIKKISNPNLETIDNGIQSMKNCLEDEKIVLLIDEMDVGQGLEKFHIFLEQMRVIMQEKGWLRIVLSSGPFITRYLIDPQSPLFNMVSHISINRLTTEAAEKLLRLAEDQDIVFEKDVIRDCLQWTGNLPQFLLKFRQLSRCVMRSQAGYAID